MIFALIGSLLFGLMAIFYLLLALGLPLGEYAMGGQQKVFSGNSRIIVLVAVNIQLFGVFVLLQAGEIIAPTLSYSVIKIACYVYAIYLTINVVMNAFSRSRKEKLVMAPLSLIVAFCYWVVILGE